MSLNGSSTSESEFVINDEQKLQIIKMSGKNYWGNPNDYQPPKHGEYRFVVCGMYQFGSIIINISKPEGFKFFQTLNAKNKYDALDYCRVNSALFHPERPDNDGPARLPGLGL